MLTSRQESILSMIITGYISNAEPVSSNQICDQLSLSSATIRNEMNTLERFGLLEKTHTSSGRIPSEAGYRYYVDNLMDLDEICATDFVNLKNQLQSNMITTRDAITEGIKLICDLTNYTVVKLGEAQYDENLKQLKLVELSDAEIIAIMVTSNGNVYNRKIDLHPDISFVDLNFVVNLVNELIADTPISEVIKKMEFDVKPIIGQYVTQYNLLYDVIVKALSNLNTSDLTIEGKSNMVFQPEFDTPEKIREFIMKLENNELLRLLQNVNEDKTTVAIGSNSHLSKDCTVITTKYQVGSEKGTIAVVGPKRMEYDKVIGYLENFKDSIQSINKEDEDER